MRPFDTSGVRRHPFAPWQAVPEQLGRTLVGRDSVLSDLLGLLSSPAGCVANHTVLVGPRGIGKTHLLSLVRHYVAGRLAPPFAVSTDLSAWTPVLFTEEEYAGQNSLANFLLNVIAKLRQENVLESLWQLPPDLPRQDDAAVCGCCFERLTRYHDERHKRILLLVDNVQKVLSGWRHSDHERFRAFLSGQGFVLIIASAPTVFKQILGQQAAFHDFFDVRPIEDLREPEVLELVGKWFAEEGRIDEFNARQEELSRKLPAILALTGGNPRLILFVAQVATRNTFLEIEVALAQLMEDLREYFVRRFDDLAEQPRKVLDTLCEMPGPATPSEIALATRLPVAKVNAQLQRLKQQHYVRPIKLQRQRATRYDVSERLFRIWRQTASVAGQQRFRFLVDFLKLYYTPEDIRSLYEEHTRGLRRLPGADKQGILHHVEEMYYVQAAAPADLRCDIFRSRADALVTVGMGRRAEQEAASFLRETLDQGDAEGTRSAYDVQAQLHLQSGRYKDAADDVSELLKLGGAAEAEKHARALTAQKPSDADGWRLLGIAVVRQGNHEQALDAYRKAAEIGGPTMDLWERQSRALLALKRFPEAAECARRVIELEPGNVGGWEGLGWALHFTDQNEPALEAFCKAADIGGPTAERWRRQSMVLQALKRFPEAAECARKAVELEPDNAGAWERLGWALCLADQNEPALEAFRKAADIGGPTAERWRRQSMALRALKRLPEAAQCAQHATEMAPQSADAWKELGRTAFLAGDYEQALDACRRASEAGGPTAELGVWQSAALLELKRFPEAAECARRAVDMDPQNPVSWEELGCALYFAEKNEPALEAYHKAAELGGSTADLWRGQSRVLLALKRLPEATECARHAAEMAPQNPTTWEELGRTAFGSGDYEQALGAFRKAAELGGPTVELWRLQSVALRSLGRHPEALAAAEQACDLVPDHPEMILTVVLSLWKLGRHEDALARLEAAPQAANTPELLLRKAWCLVRLQRADDALTAVDQAETIGASPREVHRFRGDILLLAGRYAEALEDLDAALTVEPQYWSPAADREIALACLGRHGKRMEALPVALAAVPIPPRDLAGVCEYILGVASGALRKGEADVGLNLLRAVLAMEAWHELDWYGAQMGTFLRHVLQLVPERFADAVDMVRATVRNADVLRLVDPFIQAVEYFRTGDVTILERLFPEVREVVMEIAERLGRPRPTGLLANG